MTSARSLDILMYELNESGTVDQVTSQFRKEKSIEFRKLVSYQATLRILTNSKQEKT
jgi:hypothetical protein